MEKTKGENLYADRFSYFLGHTNEKEILREEILKEIKDSGARSLLDIGAGRGDLSKPVASAVEHYVAVEQKEKYVQALSELGLNVVEGTFPDVEVNESFDFVLSSHSISFRETPLVPFLKKAVSLLKNGGTMLIVTHKNGERDDWTRLVESIGEPAEDRYKEKFEEIADLLKSYGEVGVRAVETFVRTKSPEEMSKALSFVFSNANPELTVRWDSHAQEVKKYLDEHYKNGEEVAFPFKHYFILLKKA